MMTTRTCFILALVSIAQSAFSRQFYVDSQRGNDSWGGSKEHPWQSLAVVRKATFLPGDRLCFRRGSQFMGTLVFTHSGTTQKPIVLTAYGTGPAPRFSNPIFDSESLGRVLQLKGSHVIVEHLYFYDNPIPPSTLHPDVRHDYVTQMGALFIHKGANSVCVRHCEFAHSPIGIRVRGAHNQIIHNYLHDADSITYRWGSIAIVVVGPYNEIAHNKVVNYGYYGGKFGLDGAAVELDGEDKLFNADHTSIHHNYSINTKGGFLEITGRTTDVTVAYNVSDDIDKFVGVNGVKQLQIYNNTIVRTRTPDFYQIVFWSLNKQRDDEMSITNNIIYLNPRVYVYITPKRDWGIGNKPRSHNLYFCPNGSAIDLLGVSPDEGAQFADPQFVDPKNGDFRLKPQSPARSAGIQMPTDLNRGSTVPNLGAL
ncbi:hypothetical protein GO755_00710 [Spirosoma sp. HMF4905]|uniref:Right handed beta helix domain-containing protein n=1 Tax=Spirosoma arboris TaxID=2682092 RepID=A0A7K1S3Y1_9BACT|nr:chondroitinase-B domain-containing protein [Spirosoma arboris]MVM28532.1 hypothetical protein [Spirosoma arboris]